MSSAQNTKQKIKKLTSKAHVLDSEALVSSQKESKTMTKTNQFYQKKSIEKHINKIFNMSKYGKEQLNAAIKEEQTAQQQTTSTHDRSKEENYEKAPKPSSKLSFSNSKQTHTKMKSSDLKIISEDMTFQIDKDKYRLLSQVTPVSKKNKFYKSLKPLGLNFNKPSNDQINNTNNAINTRNKESKVSSSEIVKEESVSTEENYNNCEHDDRAKTNTKERASTQVSPSNNNTNSNISKKPLLQKAIFPKSLNYSTVNTSMSNSISYNYPKPKTPCSYQSKQIHKFLLKNNKIKEPVSTKNSEAKPFKAIFSSFDISKEAMSLEEDGNDSYDYFKNFYSQIISEKQIEAENLCKANKKAEEAETEKGLFFSSKDGNGKEKKSSLERGTSNNQRIEVKKRNLSIQVSTTAIPKQQQQSGNIVNTPSTNTHLPIVKTTIKKGSYLNSNSNNNNRNTEKYRISMNSNTPKGKKHFSNELHLNSLSKEENKIKVRANSKIQKVRSSEQQKQDSNNNSNNNHLFGSGTSNIINATSNNSSSNNNGSSPQTKKLFFLSQKTNDKLKTLTFRGSKISKKK